ncbi:hypothetical protein GCM10009674_04080 [Nesterenkonia xinjiangensis]
MQGRAFLTTAGSGTLGLLAGSHFVGATPSRATSASARGSSNGAAALTSAETEAQLEAQIEEILSALEDLPEDLREAPPEDLPDRKARLSQELGDLTTVDPELTVKVLGVNSVIDACMV